MAASVAGEVMAAGLLAAGQRAGCATADPEAEAEAATSSNPAARNRRAVDWGMGKTGTLGLGTFPKSHGVSGQVKRRAANASAALNVKSFPCVERHAAVWLWLGGLPADPDRIPDYAFIDTTAPEARVKGYLHSATDYRLMIDNIMDLTHADYLHRDLLGGGINTLAKARVEAEGDTVRITWTAEDELLAPLHAQALGTPDGRGDFHNSVLYEAPGHMKQRIKLALPGQIASHPHDSMIGGQDFWSLRPAMLPSDKGAVLARRILDRLLAQENNAS